MPTIEIVELPEPDWHRALVIWLRQLLSDKGLDILAAAVRRRDPALIRGETYESSDGIVEAACLLAYPPWQECRLHRWQEFEGEWERVQRLIDGIEGRRISGALIAWYDAEPEAEVMGVLQAEINAEIARRGTL